MPGWLVPRTIPAVTVDLRARARSGVAYLLTDWQNHITGEGNDSYYRVALKVVDRSGLEEAGKIQEDFDPRFQTLTLNFVHIIRDGRVIDLTDKVEFRLVQRETELDNGIINGELTMLANLPDVRVGDIVDYATTSGTHDSLWRGHFFSSFSARMGEPILLRAIRFDAPADRPLTYKAINSDFAFKETVEAGRRIWEWVGVDQPAQDDEKYVPGGFAEFGRVNISSMANWADVARWATPLYAGDESLTPEFEARLADIAKRWPRPADRLTEVTRYLQDNIRYVGEEMGEGSYVPRRPRTVLERGYGDCKDKSLLLAIALRRLGIEAWPVLASTDIGAGLPGRLPSPIAFNHVIVRADLDGKPLWIDPTSTHQGGRGAGIVSADYGYGLPIRAGQAGLEPMTGYQDHAGRMAVTERFHVDEKADPAVRLDVVTVYTEGMADGMRASFSSKPASDVSKDNLKYYRQRYPGLAETRDLKIEDDRDANRVTMTESYTLSQGDFRKAGLLSKFVTQAYAVTDLLPERQTDARRNPLYVQGAIDREQVIELAVAGRRMGGLEDIDEKAEGISFSRRSSQDGGILRMVYRLKSGSEEQVAPDRAAAVFALSDKIAEEKGIEFYLDKAPTTAESPDASLAQIIAPVRSEIGKAGELMEKNDQASLVEALTLLNTLTPRVKRPSELAGLVDGMKGAVLARLGRYQPARTALESSIAQYRRSGEMFYLLAAIQVDQREPIAAVHTLKQAAPGQPEMIKGLGLDFLRPLWSQLRALDSAEGEAASGDLAILLAQAGWRQSPVTADGEQIVASAIEALVKRGALDDAGKLLDWSTSTETVLRLATDSRFKALWPRLEPTVQDRFRQRMATEIAAAAAAAAKAPDDFDAMRRYVHILRLSGDAPRAVAAGRALAAQGDRIEATGDTAFWFVNEYAYALFEAGRPEDAIAQFDGLLKLGLDAYPDLVSQAINRGLLLNGMDRPQKALEAMKALDAAEDRASLYGRMLVRAGLVCALSSLQRAAEAEPVMARMDADASANPGAVMLAAACLGNKDKVEAMLLRRLDETKSRTEALIGFADFTRYKPRSDFDRRVQGLTSEVRKRPAVQAKLSSVGRSVVIDGNDIY